MIELDDAELESQLRQTFQRATAPVHGDGVRQDVIRHQAARRLAAHRRARRARRIGLVAAVAAAAAVVAFVAVGVDRNGDRVDTDPVTQPTVPAPPTTAPRTTAPPTVPSTETPSTTPSTTPSSLPAFPPDETHLTHGGAIWGVFLAGVATNDIQDPALTEAVRVAEQAGYRTGPTDCDEGAAEALGVSAKPPASVMTVGVYFDTQAQAEQARAAFEARGHKATVAHVRTFCLD